MAKKKSSISNSVVKMEIDSDKSSSSKSGNLNNFTHSSIKKKKKLVNESLKEKSIRFPSTLFKKREKSKKRVETTWVCEPTDSLDEQKIKPCDKDVEKKLSNFSPNLLEEQEKVPKTIKAVFKSNDSLNRKKKKPRKKRAKKELETSSNLIEAKEKPEKKVITLPKLIEKVPPPKENTIFVGNLPNDFNKKKLMKLFSKCGDVENLRIRGIKPVSEKTPKRVAFMKKLFHKNQLSVVAYLSFKSTEDAKKATILNGEVFDNRRLRVTLSTEKDYNKEKGIFVGNLPYTITDDDLWNFFADCGCIIAARVIRCKQTGIGKGFGYVNFKFSDGVELALKLNGLELNGRPVRIQRLVSEGKKKKIKQKQALKTSKLPAKTNKKSKLNKTNTNSSTGKSLFKPKKKKVNMMEKKKKVLAEKLLAKPKKKLDTNTQL